MPGPHLRPTPLGLMGVAVLLVLLQAHRSEATPPCRVLAIAPPAASCAHGTAKDYCENVVCAKGPGEQCGGSYNVDGKCGDGMQCRCGVCTGCSLETLECHGGRGACLY